MEEEDSYSLKVLNSENVKNDPRASGNSEDHDDRNLIDNVDSVTKPEETNENDQDDKKEDEDNTGATFSVIVESQSYDQ